MRSLFVAILLASPFALFADTPKLPAPAPNPRPKLEQPDTEYRLPKEALTPQEIVILADPGDVRDWGHAAIDVDGAWKATKGKGVTVAVLDTGIDHGHRDFKDAIKASRDFTGSRSGDADVHGHGSHCAGIIGARENGVGMVGVAPECLILSGKVLNDRGYGSSSGIAAGVDWAVANSAEVISISIGGGYSTRTHEAIKKAEAAGVIVVAAAGNEGPSDGTVTYPGAHPECICVAAINNKIAVADFSSRGTRVDVAGPGVNVRSCYPGDRFATMSGTSMATPYVAGVAALYVSHCKANGWKPSPAEFRRIIENTSRDIDKPGKDNATGFGLIQPAKIIAALTPPKVPDDKLILIPGDDFPILIGGRKVKRIIFEFEEEKK